MKLPKPIQNLILSFERLPGIGSKTAGRLAFYLLKASEAEAKEFAQSILDVKQNLSLCKVCHNVCEGELCAVCSDNSREKTTICVVENVLNLMAVEDTGFNGVYHVLHGVLNPLSGVNVEDIKLQSLFNRLQKQASEHKEGDELELILATNPTMEGESTAMYIKRQLENMQIINKFKVTRIGRGIPTGGDIEFADKTTLDNAFAGRKEF